MSKKNVKVFLFSAVIAISLAIAIPYVFGGKLATELEGNRIIRTAVATADSDLSASQRTWVYYRANLTAKDYVPNDTDTSVEETDGNAPVFSFSFNDNAGTATVVIYGIKRPETTAEQAYTPMEPIFSATLAAGTQQTGDTSARFFADTGVEAYDRWGETSIIDGQANNGVTKIQFDGRGYYAFVVLFTVVSGSDNVTCYATYY